MKKKKGFTLIELIATVAILAIAISGITAAFSASSYVWKTENIKLNNVTHNQTIAQSFRAAGKDEITSIYSSSPKVNGSDGVSRVHFYIYFNNYDDIENNIRTKNFKIISSNITGWFQDCYSKRVDSSKYGALVTIEDIKGDNYYPLYKLTINVWNLNEGEKYNSETVSYIGR